MPIFTEYVPALVIVKASLPVVQVLEGEQFFDIVILQLLVTFFPPLFNTTILFISSVKSNVADPSSNVTVNTVIPAAWKLIFFSIAVR